MREKCEEITNIDLKVKLAGFINDDLDVRVTEKEGKRLVA